jgi:hypothetical protein
MTPSDSTSAYDSSASASSSGDNERRRSRTALVSAQAIVCREVTRALTGLEVCLVDLFRDAVRPAKRLLDLVGLVNEVFHVVVYRLRAGEEKV